MCVWVYALPYRIVLVVCIIGDDDDEFVLYGNAVGAVGPHERKEQ